MNFEFTVFNINFYSLLCTMHLLKRMRTEQEKSQYEMDKGPPKKKINVMTTARAATKVD